MKYLEAILSPERSNRITVTLANTIFGALSGDRKVDWGVVMRDQTKRLVGDIGKSKPSPITPFLYHLYQAHGWLTNRELDSYDTAKAMSEFEIEDPDEEAGQEEEDSEANTILGEEAKSQWRRQDRKEKDSEIREGSKGVDPVWNQDPLGRIVKELSEFQVQYEKSQKTIQELCQLLKINQP